MAGEDRWVAKAVRHIRDFAYEPRTEPRELPAPRPKIGLALGGGFARGIAHIGVLRVFEENQIPIDYLAGTSVGALIAAAYAGGSTLEEMEQVGLATRFKDFAEWTVSWQGLATDTRLQRYLRRLTPVRWFEEVRIPLGIVATDILTAEPVCITKGDIGSALCASCAYPGLFRPVERDGRLLVDGFLAAPVPTEAARNLGADFVIAVNLASFSKDERPTNLFEIISRSFSILMNHTETNWRPAADVVIEPDVTEFRWDDFPRTPELIAAGARAARSAMPQVLKALGRERPMGELAREAARAETEQGAEDR